MRHILIDNARKKKSEKGGGQQKRVQAPFKGKCTYSAGPSDANAVVGLGGLGQKKQSLRLSRRCRTLQDLAEFKPPQRMRSATAPFHFFLDSSGFSLKLPRYGSPSATALTIPNSCSTPSFSCVPAKHEALPSASPFWGSAFKMTSNSSFVFSSPWVSDTSAQHLREPDPLGGLDENASTTHGPSGR